VAAATPERAASIRQMLTKIARTLGETPEAVFQRYARERLLARLSRTEHGPRFVLKGASLFYVWTEEPHRPTKDIDLLGLGPMDLETVANIFKAVCALDDEEDGIVFDPASVSAEDIREDSEYGGVRIRLSGSLTKARLRMQIDIGVGDVVTPAAGPIEYPALLPGLGLKPARLLGYPKETAVAEKVQTIVKLAMVNSRMKDYYDLDEMARAFAFQGVHLVEALRATFARRETALPVEVPTGLTDAFAEDATKRAQWEGFLRRSGLAHRELGEVVRSIRAFLWPALESALVPGNFSTTWVSGGPWT
jgi:hypothetical protein